MNILGMICHTHNLFYSMFLKDGPPPGAGTPRWALLVTSHAPRAGGAITGVKPMEAAAVNVSICFFVSLNKKGHSNLASLRISAAYVHIHHGCRAIRVCPTVLPTESLWQISYCLTSKTLQYMWCMFFGSLAQVTRQKPGGAYDGWPRALGLRFRKNKSQAGASMMRNVGA